jgi:hypothetical protein
MPFLTLKLGETVHFQITNPQTGIEKCQVKIDRVDNSHPKVRSFTGMYNGKKIYFIEFKELEDQASVNTGNSNFSLLQFRASNQAEINAYRGCHLVINSRLPRDARLYLPAHLECYLFQSDLNPEHIRDNSGDKKSFALAKRETTTSPALIAASLAPKPVVTSAAASIEIPNITDPTLLGNLFNPGDSTRRLLAEQKKDEAIRIARLAEQKRKREEEEKITATIKEQEKKRQRLSTIPPTILAAAASSSSLAKISQPAAKINAPVVAAAALPPPSKKTPLERRKDVVTKLRQWLGDEANTRQVLPHQIDILKQLCALREKNTDSHYRCKTIVSLPHGTGATNIIEMMAAYGGNKTVIIVRGRLQKERLAAEIEKFLTGKVHVDTRADKYHFRIKTGTQEEKQNKKMANYQKSLEKNDILIQTYRSIKNNYQYLPWDVVDSVVCLDADYLTHPSYEPLFRFLDKEKNQEIIVYTEEISPALNALFSNACIHSLSLREAIDKKILTPVQTGLLVVETSKTINSDTESNVSDAAAASASAATDQKKRHYKNFPLNMHYYHHLLIQFLLNNISPATQEPLYTLPTIVTYFHCEPSYLDACKKALEEAIPMNKIDQDGKCYQEYARNIVKKWPNYELEHALERAKEEFTICEVFHPGRNKLHELHGMLDRFEMGGIQFLLVNGYSLRSYSPARLKQCIVFHLLPSDQSQLDAWPMRMNPRDPHKVAHVIQVITHDLLHGSKLFARRLSTEDTLNFQYGLPSNSSQQPIQVAEEEEGSYKIYWKATEELKAVLEKKRANRKDVSDSQEMDDNDSSDASVQSLPRTPSFYQPSRPVASSAAAAQSILDHDADEIMSVSAEEPGFQLR